MPEMRLVEAPGPGGPIDVWIASPPGAGDEPLPTVVDVHGGPLGAWAPAPHVEVILLASAGYRVVLPNIRGSATYGRDWITAAARRLGRRRCRRRPRRGRPRRRASGWPTRSGSASWA